MGAMKQLMLEMDHFRRNAENHLGGDEVQVSLSEDGVGLDMSVETFQALAGILDSYINPQFTIAPLEG
jgi:hypothetical protein